MSGQSSNLQDHLSELIRGQELPLPPLDPSHVEAILDLLQRAYEGIKKDYPVSVHIDNEPHLNSLMVDRLDRMVVDDPVARLLVRSVSRGTEMKNYNATRLEVRPDIQISLTSKQHRFPLHVECKIIDARKGNSLLRYCRDGLARFITGDYAWANSEAMMLAYVRGSASSASHLRPYLADAMALSPSKYAVVSLPQRCVASLPDAAHSVHGRNFSYVHRAQAGKRPGDIVVWHLWVS